MNHRLAWLLASMVLAATSGCVVAPARGGMVMSPATVYVEPTYPSPGVGYVWEVHPHYGWGWRHPAHGWHKGWR
jgi:hypothetical protein